MRWKRELVALLLLLSFMSRDCKYSNPLAVPRVGLQCVIVVFPGHTRLPFNVFNGIFKI